VAAIDGDELIGFVVEAVPGQLDVGMRQRDALELRVVECGRIGAGRHLAAEEPVAIQRIGTAERNGGCGILGAAQRGGGAGGHQKRSSIH
jgi:hypothetical protein